MGAGSNSSDNSSRPLTAQERSDIFTQAIGDIGKAQTSMNTPGYTAPTFQGLSGGDYNALQDSILKGATSGLDYAKGQDMKNLDNDLAKRGIWSSGLAEQAIGDLNAKYAPQYEKAGADATTSRYNLQSQESNAQNTFNLANAQQTNSSQWKPLEFLQGLWNGTGGAISSGGSSGFNFNI